MATASGAASLGGAAAVVEGAVAGVGATVAGALAGLAVLLVPKPAGDVRDGTFPNNPTLSYHWDEGELTLYRTNEAGEREQLFCGRADADGNFRDASGTIIAHSTPSGWVADLSVLENRQEKEGETTDEVKEEGEREKKRTVSGLSGSAKANDVPSWAKGERPYVDENGREFAKRLCDKRFGPGKYKTGPGSDFNKIKKWGERNFY